MSRVKAPRMKLVKQPKGGDVVPLPPSPDTLELLGQVGLSTISDRGRTELADLIAIPDPLIFESMAKAKKLDRNTRRRLRKLRQSDTAKKLHAALQKSAQQPPKEG